MSDKTNKMSMNDILSVVNNVMQSTKKNTITPNYSSTDVLHHDNLMVNNYDKESNKIENIKKESIQDNQCAESKNTAIDSFVKSAIHSWLDQNHSVIYDAVKKSMNEGYNFENQMKRIIHDEVRKVLSRILSGISNDSME